MKQVKGRLLVTLFWMTIAWSIEAATKIGDQTVVEPLKESSAGPSYIFVVHGIGYHCIGHADPLIMQLAYQRKLRGIKSSAQVAGSVCKQTGSTTYSNFEAKQNQRCNELPNCTTLTHDLGSRRYKYGHLRVVDLFDQSDDPKLKFRVFELTWSAATVDLKRHNFPSMKSNYALNRRVHDSLLNDALVDAVLYIGDFKPHIQLPFFDTFCYMSLPPNQVFKDGQLSEDCSFKDVFASQKDFLQGIQLETAPCKQIDAQRRSIAKKETENFTRKLEQLVRENQKSPIINVVSSSLGSRIVFDVLRDLTRHTSETDTINTVLKAHQLGTETDRYALRMSGFLLENRIDTVYMLANQLPLLELSYLTNRRGDYSRKPWGGDFENDIDVWFETMSRLSCEKNTQQKLIAEVSELEDNSAKEQTFWVEIQKIKAEIELELKTRNAELMAHENDTHSLKLGTEELNKKSHQNEYQLTKLLSQVVYVSEPDDEFTLEERFLGLVSKDLINDKTNAVFLIEKNKDLFSAAKEFESISEQNRVEFSQRRIALFDLIHTSLMATEFWLALGDPSNFAELASQYSINKPDIDVDGAAEELFNLAETYSDNWIKLADQLQALTNKRFVTEQVREKIAQLEPIRIQRLSQFKRRTETRDLALKEKDNKMAALETSNKILAQIEGELAKINNSYRQLGEFQKALSKMGNRRVILFGDPADVLNYGREAFSDIDQYGLAETTFFEKEVDISKLKIPGIYADMVAAHQNYIFDKEVQSLIICGNESVNAVCQQDQIEDVDDLGWPSENR